MASQPSILPKDAPDFFKIIQPHVVREGRLRIPKMIVAKYGKDLPDRMHLKVPNGEVWVVNLSVSNGEVWMQDGWKEFAEHYSIGLYHLLVFRNEGSSHFQVLIFDKSASEIEYPSPNMVHEERTNLHGESQMKRKGVIDENNTNSNKKTRSNLTYEEQDFEGRRVVTQMEESTKNVSNCTQACRMKNVKLEEEPHSRDVVEEVGDGVSGSMQSTRTMLHPHESKRMASLIEKVRALQFTSENPFFIATMQPSYLKISLSVPRSFMNKYFSKKGKASTKVNLGVLDGRIWPVHCSDNMKKLCKGWPRFASDNYLEVGDVCIFELIKDFKDFLNVVIFRARKHTNC